MGNHPSHVRWRNDNKEHIKKYNKIYSANLRQTRTEHWLHLRAKARAKDAMIPFNIEVSDITIPTHCPILGIELYRNAGENRPGPNSPSLDKIDSSLGYIKGNIHVISYKANRMKNNASLEELKRFAEWVNQNI